MDKEEEQKNLNNQHNVTYIANLKKAFEENDVSTDIVEKFFSLYGKKAVFLRSIQNKDDSTRFKDILAGKIKLDFEEISTISQIVLEFNQTFEPDAKKQKTAESNNKDITQTINKAIQNYVIKYFSSEGKKLDLLQDKQRIKDVFKQDGDLIDEISSEIGRIGIHYPDANDFSNETIVQQIFDLKDSGSTSNFSPIFFDLFEERMEEYESEAVCIAENYLLFAKSIKKYLKSARRNSTLKILQDKAQNSSNTTTKTKTNNNLQSEPAFVDNEIEYDKFGSLRPDFRLQDEKMRVFQRVEVKRTCSDLHKAKAELTGKCYRLNKYQYGALKTQFALALAGNTAVYYLLDFTLTCEKDCNIPNCNHPKSQRTGRNSLIELREYNLSYLKDRIALVFNSFVIAELCYLLESTFGIPPEFKSINHGDTLLRTRNNGRTNYATIDFHYQFNMVEKFVFEEDEISSTKLLESFYNKVQETQDTSTPAIANIVKIEKFKISRLSCKAHPFVIKLQIKPIGYLYEALISKLTSDIKQFEKAIIYVMEAALSMHANGYVHRDIRWPNITYDPDKDTYLLFDFEQIGVDCNQRPSDKTHCSYHHERYYCTPAIFDVASIIKLFCLPKEFFFPDLIKYYKEYIVFANTDLKAIQNNNRTLKRLFWEFYEKNVGQVEGLDETMVEKRVNERKKEAKF